LRRQEGAVAAVKISSKVDGSVWKELKDLADESHQNISRLLTEAIREYIQRRRVRPVVRRHLEDPIVENEKLGRLLAK
jgi:predicted transcriptional regulator